MKELQPVPEVTTIAATCGHVIQIWALGSLPALTTTHLLKLRPPIVLLHLCSFGTLHSMPPQLTFAVFLLLLLTSMPSLALHKAAAASQRARASRPCQQRHWVGAAARTTLLGGLHTSPCQWAGLRRLRLPGMAGIHALYMNFLQPQNCSEPRSLSCRVANRATAMKFWRCLLPCKARCRAVKNSQVGETGS